MAKALSTADWMSGGRITVTFGVGSDARNSRFSGVPFPRARTTWPTNTSPPSWNCGPSDSPEFDGKYVSFKDVAFEPKPLQKPHLPIWMGGDAEPMLKRAARYGSGWFPWLTSPADIPAKIDFIKSQPTYDGRRVRGAVWRVAHSSAKDTL